MKFGEVQVKRVMDEIAGTQGAFHGNCRPRILCHTNEKMRVRIGPKSRTRRQRTGLAIMSKDVFGHNTNFRFFRLSPSQTWKKSNLPSVSFYYVQELKGVQYIILGIIFSPKTISDIMAGFGFHSPFLLTGSVLTVTFSFA